jgi:hypothetical protein
MEPKFSVKQWSRNCYGDMKLEKAVIQVHLIPESYWLHMFYEAGVKNGEFSTWFKDLTTPNPASKRNIFKGISLLNDLSFGFGDDEQGLKTRGSYDKPINTNVLPVSTRQLFLDVLHLLSSCYWWSSSIEYVSASLV